MVKATHDAVVKGDDNLYLIYLTFSRGDRRVIDHLHFNA